MPDRILTLRELNRALLARQMLLEREPLTVVEAIHRLVGLQGQMANPPYVGLWSRLQGFQKADLIHALERREVVRATLMRATLHLFTAADYLRFRLALQPMLTGALSGVSKDRMGGITIEQVVESARELVDEQPRSFSEMRELLLQRHPDTDERMLGYGVRTHLPLIQVYPAGVWDVNTEAAYVTAEAWLGQPLAPVEGTLPEMIRRFLTGFGPATVADMQKWSAMSGLKPVVEGMRPTLRTFRNEQGRELFDVPDGLLPDADTPAPVRFTPDYDNLVLAHDDRTRIINKEYHKVVFHPTTRVWATILVDGFVAGIWKIERKKRKATLTISPLKSLTDAERAELVAEGERLLRFVAGDVSEIAVEFAS